MPWVFNPFTGKLDQTGSGGGAQADWNATSGASQILNKPSSFTPSAHASSHASGGADALTLAASQVTGLSAVATSGAYSSLTGTPTLATVATSGSAADLTGTLADARLSSNVLLLTGTQSITGNKSFDAGTLTASQPLSITQTWNASGTLFTGKRTNITATAFATGSRVEEWQVGGVPQLSLTAAKQMWLWNQRTDDSNYERGFMRWNANVLEIGTEAGGTGTARGFALVPGVASGGLFGLRIQGSTTTVNNGPSLDFVCSTNNAAAATAQIYASRIDSNTGDLGLKGRLIHIGATGTGFAGTNAYPALKRSSTTLQIRLADDSAFASVQGKLTTDTAYAAGSVTATGYITLYDSTGTAYRVPCAV